jgi:hypothetical protein
MKRKALAGQLLQCNENDLRALAAAAHFRTREVPSPVLDRRVGQKAEAMSQGVNALR